MPRTRKASYIFRFRSAPQSQAKCTVFRLSWRAWLRPRPSRRRLSSPGLAPAVGSAARPAALSSQRARLVSLLRALADFVVTHFVLRAAAAKAVGPRMQTSEAIPFLDKPPALDGSLAGDVGFDPLGFSNYYDMNWLRVLQQAEK